MLVGMFWNICVKLPPLNKKQKKKKERNKQKSKKERKKKNTLNYEKKFGTTEQSREKNLILIKEDKGIDQQIIKSVWN